MRVSLLCLGSKTDASIKRNPTGTCYPRLNGMKGIFVDSQSEYLALYLPIADRRKSLPVRGEPWDAPTQSNECLEHQSKRTCINYIHDERHGCICVGSLPENGWLLRRRLLKSKRRKPPIRNRQPSITTTKDLKGTHQFRAL